MATLPEDPEWYLDNVLVNATPGGPGATAPLGPIAIWRDTWQRRADHADGLLAAAARQGFVLTMAELATAGWTRSATRAAVRRGQWWSPARGVIAPMSPDDLGDDHKTARSRHALAATGLWRARPDHTVAGNTGAILHGLPVMRTPDEPQLLAPSRQSLGIRSPGHAFGARLHEGEVTRWFGVRVTTVSRTLVDVARHDARDGIVAADAALREQVTTRCEIDTALAGAAGWPGVRSARMVLGAADPMAESPLESLVRLNLLTDGFPMPELQADIGGYRVDFLWRAQRLILEADGRTKYTGDALWREKRREHELRALGYRVERVLWSDLFARWPAFAARLRAALRAS